MTLDRPFLANIVVVVSFAVALVACGGGGKAAPGAAEPAAATNTKVTVSGRRRGSQNVQTVTWTMDDAKKAGIAGNPNYAKYPRQMLLARASAELVRAMCPDVLGGITSFAEEAADLPDDGPTFTTATIVTDEEKPKTTRRRRSFWDRCWMPTGNPSSSMDCMRCSSATASRTSQ